MTPQAHKRLTNYLRIHREALLRAVQPTSNRKRFYAQLDRITGIVCTACFLNCNDPEVKHKIAEIFPAT